MLSGSAGDDGALDAQRELIVAGDDERRSLAALCLVGASSATLERLLAPLLATELGGAALGGALAVATVCSAASAVALPLSRTLKERSDALALLAAIASVAAWPAFTWTSGRLGPGAGALVLAVPLGIGAAAAAGAVARTPDTRGLAAWLVGLAIGSALCTGLLGPLPASRVVAVAGALAWLAALALGTPSRRRALRALALATGLGAVAVGWVLGPFAHARVGGTATAAGARDIMRGKGSLAWWSTAGRSEARSLAGDAATLGVITRRPDELWAARAWDGKQAGEDLPDRNHPGSPIARMCSETPFGEAYYRARPRVLVLGASPEDVQCALYHDAARVTVAIDDAALLAALRSKPAARAWGGHEDRLEWRHEPERRALRQAKGSGIDLVVLAPPSREEALVAGAWMLPESRLHTVETLVEAFDALSGGGVVATVVRGEREALRWTTTALAALRRSGREHPEQHLAIFGNGSAYGVMVRREPYGMDELLQLHAALRPAVFRGLADRGTTLQRRRLELPTRLLFAHGSAFDNRFGVLMAHASRGDEAMFVDAYALELAPARDDLPDFGRASRLDRPDTWRRPPTATRALKSGFFALGACIVLLALAGARRGTERVRPAIRAGAAGGAMAVGLSLALGVAWLAHASAPWWPEHAAAVGYAWTLVLAGAAMGLARAPERAQAAAVAGSLLATLAWAAARWLLPALAGGAAAAAAAGLAVTFGLGASWLLASVWRRAEALGALLPGSLALGLGSGTLLAWALAMHEGYALTGLVSVMAVWIAEVASVAADRGDAARASTA